MKLKSGDIVKIYHDPITKTKLEGEARLVKKLSSDEGLEDWQVIFISDPKLLCVRTIYTE